MFIKIYKDPVTISRYINAPLLEDRLCYLNYRANQKTAVGVLKQIAAYQLILIKYLSPEQNKIVNKKDIESAAEHWMRNEPHRSCLTNNHSIACKKRFIQHANQWLRFVGRLEITPKDIPDQIIKFADYMRQEKGLSELTIVKIGEQLQRFFSQIKEKPDRFLADLAPAQLDELIIEKQGIYARSSMRNYVSKLRSFLRFAEDQGWCRKGIADSIQAPRVYKHETLPSSPSWEDVQRLLKTTEGDVASNIRNRAILLLLAVYGLRASEVWRLRFEDFDWDQQTFYIKRSKCGPLQKFPLVPTVGRALMRYLKKVRPKDSTHREIFLNLYAPYPPLKSVTYIVSKRWKPLNVAIKHHGAHSLRHACATRLINQGVPLKTIADQLGHRDLETTRIYAKVDLTRLREVANFNLGGLS
jgi:site-specific recombinase XerD